MRRKGYNLVYVAVAAVTFLIAATVALAVFYNVNPVEFLQNMSSSGDRLVDIVP